MSSSPSHFNAKQAARRKLVRGVFAAPAVLTVCNASATASSSNLRCVANAVSSPPPHAPISNGLDNFCRVQLYQKGTTTPTYWVCGADLQVYKRSTNSVYLSSTQWQQVNISTGACGTPQGDPGGCTRVSKYAVVRFNAVGNCVGVGTYGSGGPMAGTCWASILTYL